MTMLSNAPPQTLYETDYTRWLEETIAKLHQHSFNELELNNLIEELENLGKEQRNAVISLLDQLIRHLLLLRYWQSEIPRHRTHWQGEIYNFRVQLADRLTQTLYNHLVLRLDEVYRRALKAVQIKTDYQIYFPQTCPFSLDQLLDIDWWPTIPEGE